MRGRELGESITLLVMLASQHTQRNSTDTAFMLPLASLALAQ